MKARVHRQELAEALGVLSGALAARTTKPILQCVMLQVGTNAGVISATDLELGVRHNLNQLEVTEGGDVVLAADKVSQIVRESSDDVLELESDERSCHLRGADSHFKLFHHEPAEFPAVPSVSGPVDFEIPAGLLRTMVTWTVFAASRENTRYAINGILWERRKDHLTVVATDGRRLALAGGKTLDKSGSDVNVIVPPRLLSLFQRLALPDDEAVGVKVLSNQILLRTSRATLSGVLIEGRFPAYREVIPTDNTESVQLRVTELASAVKRASLLTNEESKGVRFNFSSGVLGLSSRAPEQGEAQITMPINYDGSGLEIGFNPVFLLDVLKVAHQDEVRFDFRASDRPGVLRCGPDFLYVVMPISLA